MFSDLFLSFRFLSVPASACLIVLASVGITKGADQKISFRQYIGGVEATPLLYENESGCEAPQRLVSITFLKEYEALGTNYDPFLPPESRRKPVIVRRSGKIEDDKTVTRSAITVSSARFSNTDTAREEFRKASNLNLSGKLFFCEYSGFLAFVRATIDLSGDLGDFTARSDWVLEPSTDQLRIGYGSSNLLSEEGEIESTGIFPFDFHHGNSPGSLYIEFFAADVPFDQKSGGETMPVDVRAFVDFDIVLASDKNE